MEYFATSNLLYNGQTYTIGDKVEMSEATASSLLEAGVLSYEAPSETSPAEPVEEVPEAQPSVGGTRTESGEPSLDSTEAPVDGDAKDVTPGVAQAAQEPAQAAEAPSENDANDPSADL